MADLVGAHVTLQDLKARPELNGAGATVVETAAGGLGPAAASGRYGVRIEVPSQHRGVAVKVKPDNLRLAPHALAGQIRRASSKRAVGAGSDAAHIANTIASKFGELRVSVHEPPAPPA